LAVSPHGGQPAWRSITNQLTTTNCASMGTFLILTHFLFQPDLNSLSILLLYHIRQLHCIRPYLDFKTASTIGTSVVHSKLDYCNSLYYNLPKSQITRLQQIQNSLARAVVKAPTFSHITPILHSLHSSLAQNN